VVETNTTNNPDKSAVHENALGRARILYMSALAIGKSVVPDSISELMNESVESQKHVRGAIQILT
jgi:hypothetical protein